MESLSFFFIQGDFEIAASNPVGFIGLGFIFVGVPNIAVDPDVAGVDHLYVWPKIAEGQMSTGLVWFQLLRCFFSVADLFIRVNIF